MKWTFVPYICGLCPKLSDRVVGADRTVDKFLLMRADFDRVEEGGCCCRCSSCLPYFCHTEKVAGVAWVAVGPEINRRGCFFTHRANKPLIRSTSERDSRERRDEKI